MLWKQNFNHLVLVPVKLEEIKISQMDRMWFEGEKFRTKNILFPSKAIWKFPPKRSKRSGDVPTPSDQEFHSYSIVL